MYVNSLFLEEKQRQQVMVNLPEATDTLPSPAHSKFESGAFPDTIVGPRGVAIPRARLI
jgi:hypothetical protein